MIEESIPFLLVTANVGSVFEDPSRLLNTWIQEFLHKITVQRPQFVALHLQEVGGKTYEKSMEYVQEFIKTLCESNELENYNRIRVFLDEDYTSAEHFTALGNLYFIEKSIKNIKIWNFLTHEWDSVDGKNIHTGNIEAVPTKEKSKFPQHFFPECKWSRKGFLRTRWEINGTVIDLINIHLFHDASNLAACEEFPSVYCKSRRRALVHTLEKIHSDHINGTAPYFLFGDFNFRCDTEGVIKKLTEDLTVHRIQNAKSDNTKVQYKDSDGGNVLTIGKKEFTHIDHQTKFKESWLQQFDRELEPLKEVLVEYPITFPPSYPFEEEPSLPHNYMFTRCPAWCDRILMSPSMKNIIIDDNFSVSDYNVIGGDVCMGDHKPVYLNISLKLYQGILRCCCEHANNRMQHNNTNNNNNNNINVNDAYYYLPSYKKPFTISNYNNNNNNNINNNITTTTTSVNCLYTSHEFRTILLECIKLNKSLPLLSSSSLSTSPLSNSIYSNENYSLVVNDATKKNALQTINKTSTAMTKVCTITQTPTETTKLLVISDDIASNNNNNNNNINNSSQITGNIKPMISINVTDSENVNVCMCSLYSSNDNLFKLLSTTKNDELIIEQNVLMMNGSSSSNSKGDNTVIDTNNDNVNRICPECRNIINQQSTEHRKTLISKRLTLANDIIVNRVDTHYLNLNTFMTKLNFQEPYTPESIESHSPAPDQIDIDDDFSFIDDIPIDIDQDDDNHHHHHHLTKQNNIMVDTIEMNPLNDFLTDTTTNNENRNLQNSQNNIINLENDHIQQHQSVIKRLSGGGVSPRQLKSRLEYLYQNKSSPVINNTETIPKSVNEQSQSEQMINPKNDQQIPLNNKTIDTLINSNILNNNQNNNVNNQINTDLNTIKIDKEKNCCKPKCNIL